MISKPTSEPARILRRKGVQISLVAAVAAVLASQSAFAADRTWNDSSNSGIWDTVTATNWVGGAAWKNNNTTPDAAIFGGGFGGLVTLGEPIVASGLTFDASGYEIADGGVVGNTLTLGGTAPTIKVTNAFDNATISAVIAGTGFTKTGDGTLTLSGANTYTGGTTINAGRLAVSNVGALGAGNVAIGDGTLQIGFISGTPTIANTLSVAAGKIALLDVIGKGTANNALTINTGGITIDGTLRVTRSAGNTGTTSFSAPLTGSGTLEVGNTQSGTAIAAVSGQQGRAIFSNANAFAGFTGDVHVLNGGNLMLNNGQLTGQNVTIDSGGYVTALGGQTTVIGALNGSGSITMNNSGSATATLNVASGSFSGVIASNLLLGQGTVALTKSGSGTLTLSGANTYTGTTTISGGTLKLTRANGSTWNNSNIAMDAANSVTLQLDSTVASDSWTFSKQINGGSTNAKIEKIGPGTVVLTPAAGSSFVGNSTGALAVTEGKLFLNNNSFTTAPAVSVASGTTFGGTGTAGAVTVADGGILAGGYNGSGTLTLGSLTFGSTGTLSTALSGSTTPFVVTGAVTTGGSNSVTVSLTNVPSANGIYHLLQFGSLPGALGDFKFASPVRAVSLQKNGSFIDIAVNSSNFPIWTGSGSGEWSSNTGLNNWKLSSDSSATDFLALDNTMFDDNATGSTNITVGQTNISPGIITFNNSNKAYTLTQANNKDITSGSLVKTGSGKLTISGSFSFPGGATLNGGTVSIDNEKSLGVGDLAFGGATLEFIGAAATWTRNTTLNAGGGTIRVTDPTAVLTQSGIVSGIGSVAKDSAGTLTLSGANTYTGGTTINAGTLAVLNVGALGAGNVAIGNGTLQFGFISASPTFANTISVAAGKTALLDVIGNGTANNAITINTGGITIDGTLRVTRSLGNTGATSFSGPLTGSGTLEIGNTQSGTAIAAVSGQQGRAVFSNANAFAGFTGNVHVLEGGNLMLNNGQLTGQNVTIDSGGYLTALGGQTSIIGALNGSGSITKNATGDTATLNVASGSFSGVIASNLLLGQGAVALTKSGSDTLTLSGANTYTGTTTVSGGTLLVSGSISGSSRITVENGATLLHAGLLMDSLGDLASITLGGGTDSNPAKLKIDNSSGQLFETVGPLTLASNSILDIGTGVDGIFLNFGDSSVNAWTPGATLSIYNWSSNVDHISFGFGDTALTSAQLSSIKFYSDAGTTFLGAAVILPAGEIVPVAVPEPSALAMGVGMLGYLFSRRRRVGPWTSMDRRDS